MKRELHWSLVTIAILASQASASPPAAQETRDPRRIARVEARILPARPVSIEGEPVVAQLVLTNPSLEAVAVGEECHRPSAFVLTRAGETLPFRARKNRGEGALTLAPGQTASRTFDLAKHFRELRRPGRFWISWKCGAWESDPQPLFVTTPYDREMDRLALVRTSLGTLELGLLRDQAPLHVQSFVELARGGYFDGLAFDRLIPGLQIECGGRGEQGGGWDHQIPAEIDKSILPGKGLVGAVRRESSMTSATRFFIMLDTTPGFAGLHTFFAYVRRGGEVLDAMKGREILGDAGPAAFMMKEPVIIEKIEISQE